LRRTPTEEQPMDPPSKKCPEHPREPLHYSRLDLYGRPRSMAIALSSWERTLGSHTTQGASCIQDAATPSSAHIAAIPVQCGRCRLIRWHSLWARSPNQRSSVMGISGYLNTEGLQECGSGSDEDVTDGSATPRATRSVLCNRGSIGWKVSTECRSWRPLPHSDQSTNGFHLYNPISKYTTVCQLKLQLHNY
jgi:hypothetical protein